MFRWVMAKDVRVRFQHTPYPFFPSIKSAHFELYIYMNKYPHSIDFHFRFLSFHFIPLREKWASEWDESEISGSNGWKRELKVWFRLYLCSNRIGISRERERDGVGVRAFLKIYVVRWRVWKWKGFNSISFPFPLSHYTFSCAVCINMYVCICENSHAHTPLNNEILSGEKISFFL